LNFDSVPDSSRLMLAWCLTITINEIRTVASSSSLEWGRKKMISGMTAAATMEPSDM